MEARTEAKWDFRISYLTLLALLVYSWFTYQLWQSALGQLDAFGVSIKQAGLALKYNNKALGLSSRQVSAAETANANAIDGDRPWIGLLRFDPMKLSPDEVAPAIVAIANFGKRPAQIHQMEVDNRAYSKFPKNPRYRKAATEPSATLLMPGVQATVTVPRMIVSSAGIADMAAKGEAFYIYAHVEYVDVGTGKAHTTHICQRYEPPPAGIFAGCPTYNDGN
jgi:hypothetical protein